MRFLAALLILMPLPQEKDYSEIAGKIIKEALAGNGGWEKLEALCDGVGHRLSGSENLEKAVAWGVATMKKDGHEGVAAEACKVPKWVRGKESAEIVEPRRHDLPMLGLGGSVGTPAAGITAEVVVVADEAALDKLGDGAKGRIVLFNNPMPAYDPEKGSRYGETVKFRVNGASLAAPKGAVAVLVRSVTARSLRSPHTGMLRYKDGVDKIPAAAITTEDAAMIQRMAEKGKVVVTLKMDAKDHGLADSANVVGELRGSTKPEEIVVIGGHLDSWDVGTGAHDDGAGCVTAMEAISVLRRLKLTPKRTIRVVLWTNEENGLGGAKAYAEKHKDDKHVAGIEMDGGCFQPTGYSLEIAKEKGEAGLAKLAAILKLLAPLGPMKAEIGGSGADVSQIAASVPKLGFEVEGSKYFDYHHTHADTLDKVDPADLRKCVASMAVVAFILADMDGILGGK